MSKGDSDKKYMQQAIQLALQAQAQGEVPIGALLVKDDKIVAQAYNLRENNQDATAHAELMVIQAACKQLNSWRLTGCTLYVTLEPCVMCAGALVLSRVERVVYGALDPKAGAVHSLFNILTHPLLNHQIEVQGGVCEAECRQLLKNFFQQRRQENKLKKQMRQNVSLEREVE